MTTAAMVTAAELAQDRLGAGVVIIDCRFRLPDPLWGRQAYAQGHIPRSHYLDLNDDLSAPVGAFGGRHPLPDPAILGPKLAQLGIVQGETPVVIYDDQRFAFAARLWWLLRYWGHDLVYLLDGGWPAWIAGGHPTSTDLPHPQTGHFVPQPRTDWVTDRQGVIARNPATPLVDARTGDRYRGEQEPIDPVAGHIPGALNWPWTEITDDQGYLRSLADLQKQLSEHLPPNGDLAPILYCGSGVTACVLWFALHHLGRSPLRLYAGGWSDWCCYLPLEKNR